jgi:hypothetical protein
LPINDALLRPDRSRAVLLLRARWAGHKGEVVLAPPVPFGGEMGDHLIFRWKTKGVDYAFSLHSWAPLSEAVAMLKALVASAH